MNIRFDGLIRIEKKSKILCCNTCTMANMFSKKNEYFATESAVQKSKDITKP